MSRNPGRLNPTSVWSLDDRGLNYIACVSGHAVDATVFLGVRTRVTTNVSTAAVRHIIEELRSEAAAR